MIIRVHPFDINIGGFPSLLCFFICQNITNTIIYKYMRISEAELKIIEAKRKGKQTIPLEDEEYDLIVKYLNGLGFVYTHIPMETFTTSFKVKNRNKRIGVKSGFPDYVIIIPYWWVGKRHNILLFAEIKRQRKAYPTLSPAQKEWLHNLRSCNELAEVFYGFEELKAYIEALRK